MALADPSPLDPLEEQHPAALAVARRFNPAMALPIPDVWPVDVAYAWHDGADLMAVTEAGGGRPAETRVAVPHRDLASRDWSRLPHHAPDGRAIRYYLDAPGDDRLDPASGLSRWRARFRAIAQPGGLQAPAAASPYPPTQYAHVFWWNRARGLLAVQYWFYYPFNEWVNHHEADWEHIQVVLQGPERLADPAAFTPLGQQYFFHEFWMEPRRVVRVSGAPGSGADHPVVFVGGDGRWFAWGGAFSGGSFPQPGRYRRTGFRPRALAPDETVARGVRTLAPEEFRVVLLPEPDRLDAGRRPELSWLRLPLFAGQRSMHVNPPGYAALGRDHPPVQPGVRPAWLVPPSGAPFPELPLPIGKNDANLLSWSSNPLAP